jgi:hypothetical protein
MTRSRCWLAACGAIVLAAGGLVWAKPAGGGAGGTKNTTPHAQDTKPAQANNCDLANIQETLWCKQCGKMVEREDAGGGKHKACGTPVVPIKACVKACYTCGTCGRTSKSGGLCKTDNKEMTKTISKTRLIWRCPTCQGTAEAAGKCSNATCKGKALEVTCETSGTPPHVRVWPRD